MLNNCRPNAFFRIPDSLKPPPPSSSSSTTTNFIATQVVQNSRAVIALIKMHDFYDQEIILQKYRMDVFHYLCTNYHRRTV